MIKTEIISANALRIIAPEKLKADDFRQLAPQVNSLISQHGKIRLLIDASGFNGWENVAAFANHVGFVKNHQRKVERIAVIAAHGWQHWVIGAVKMFLLKLPRFRGHPTFGVFGVHNGKKAPALCAGIPPADDRAGSSRSHAGGTG